MFDRRLFSCIKFLVDFFFFPFFAKIWTYKSSLFLAYISQWLNPKKSTIFRETKAKIKFMEIFFSILDNSLFNLLIFLCKMISRIFSRILEHRDICIKAKHSIYIYMYSERMANGVGLRCSSIFWFNQIKSVLIRLAIEIFERGEV